MFTLTTGWRAQRRGQSTSMVTLVNPTALECSTRWASDGRWATMANPADPNQITGANAGGPRRLPVRTPWDARIAQFRRYAAP